MNYIKVIEKWLREHDDIKLKIEADWALLQDTRNDVGSGIDISREAVSKTNKFNSEVENVVLEIEEIQQRMDNNIRKIKMINDGLNKLGYTERRILELRYIKGCKWNEITKEMNYEYSWCQELRKKGIDQLVNILFDKERTKTPKLPYTF